MLKGLPRSVGDRNTSWDLDMVKGRRVVEQRPQVVNLSLRNLTENVGLRWEWVSVIGWNKGLAVKMVLSSGKSHHDDIFPLV